MVVLHNAAGAADDPSTSDVLAQAGLVADALGELGLRAVTVAVPEDGALETLRQAVREEGTVVFNLVEAPPGRPRLHPGSAAALELEGVPFTGSPAAALWLTTDKLATRALLAAEGLPVAPGGRLDLECPGVLDRVPPPWILKPALEDASIGLEGDPVCATREAALARGAGLARRFPGQPILVERFLPGRELNVSLLAGEGGGVEALPVAEIVFEGFPEGMSRVVGYEAKWHEDSFAYLHTVRAFPDPRAEAELLAEAGRLALAAWKVCGLAGYARIDLRLDEHGRPHILEVNANPCLSPGAGFLAAADQAGLSPRDVIGRILAAAVPDGIRPAAEWSMEGQGPEVAVRRGIEPGDREPIEALIRATGFFNPEEIEVALELVDDRLRQGDESHYRFLVGEVEGQVAGYACWGPIPGTSAAADLYWIVVHPDRQGEGTGAALLAAAEGWMAGEGRTRVYVETSTRAQYDGTRGFYHARGYAVAAKLLDFYAPGDGKAIFLKVLGG